VAEDQPSLLIVEDDVDVAEMLTAYFRGQGYEAFGVYEGEQALQTCRSIRPDLIILDIRLPDIDGFEVARRLRASQRTHEIPIIFLTEKRERSDRLRGLELGADDYITKPFDIQELRLRVRNSLSRKSQGPLTNPVTSLAEGALVDERLRECLSDPNWGLLLVYIEHMADFSDAYGFVASDDVLRAVSLMVHNAMRGLGGANDFIGHLGTTELILVTQPKDLLPLADRIRSRLDQSLDYFYPLKDRGKDLASGSRLVVRLGHLTSADGPFKSLDDLKRKLLEKLV